MKNFLLLLFIPAIISCTRPAVVFQTDFGVKDGAVAEMKGVALSVDPSLQLFDITHEIPGFNIWEAAYRLNQAAPFWPAGTVFVSVVDPGVGTTRKSVVLRTKSGHYFVSPDNGTLTLVAKTLGIDALREIDESENRREGSERSFTFYGRDVFAYTAARLASGKIEFREIGRKLGDSVVTIDYQEATTENGLIKGNIPVLDIQYGNVWTNIPDSMITSAGYKYGDSLLVEIFNKDSSVFRDKIILAKTFGEVAEGAGLAYFNSLMNFSLAINMGSFSNKYGVYSGPDWSVKINKK
jgi:S-adenosylmethionine hydrolase